MLTLTSAYALRALIYLARHEDDWPIPGREIASHADIPPKYLSKILGELVRRGVLASSPGKTGGFRLERPAVETTLYDVLSPFEQFERRRSPFEDDSIDDDSRDDRGSCAAHDRWRAIVDAEQRFLRETSIQEVAIAKRRKTQ